MDNPNVLSDGILTAGAYDDLMDNSNVLSDGILTAGAYDDLMDNPNVLSLSSYSQQEPTMT